MKRLILSLLLLCFSYSAFAQSGPITGPTPPDTQPIAPCYGCNIGASPADWNDEMWNALWGASYGSGWRFVTVIDIPTSVYTTYNFTRDEGAGTISVSAGSMDVEPQRNFADAFCFTTGICSNTAYLDDGLPDDTMTVK